MPSPQSSRANLEHARTLGRVKIWRQRSESQRTKADIVWLHHVNPNLSQQVIGRVLRVSQPYVAKVLRQVRVKGIRETLGPTGYEHFRERDEAHRRGDTNNAAFLTQSEVPNQRPVSTAIAQGNAASEYIEILRSPDGQIVEGHGSKPPSAMTDSELRQSLNLDCVYAPPSPQLPYQRPRYDAAVVRFDLSRTDAALLEYAGCTRKNRSNEWF